MKPGWFQQGFSLIWALVLTAIMLVLGNTLIQSASATNRAARGSVEDSLNSVRERNALVYARRLLDVNATSMLRAIPESTPDQAIPESLQEQVQRLCTRKADGRTQFRIYFTSRACDTALPAGTTLPNMPVETYSQARHYRIPFLIVVQNDDLTIQQAGTLSAWRGTTPAATYALLSSENIELNGHLSIKGDVHTDRAITVAQPGEMTGHISASNCLTITAGCAGQATINLGSTLVNSMNLTPTASQITDLPNAKLSLGQAGETAGMITPSLSGPSLSTDATTINLGVFGDGGQYIQACGPEGCVDYGTDVQGNLYQDSRSGSPLIAAWNGVIQLTGAGTVTLRPANADGNSVAIPLSLSGSQPVKVDGSITYDQTNCSGNICAGSSTAALSITAPSITVTPYTVRLHGTMITDAFTVSAPLTLFGSVLGSVRGTGDLFVQADMRANDGYRAPLTPLLASQWRKIQIQVNP